MDQNSEALNRAINETLKQVDRGRRRRGAVTVGLGILASLLAYGLPLIGQWAHRIPNTFLRLLAYPGLALVLYGGGVMVLGSKARLLYLKYFGMRPAGRVFFHLMLIVLAALLDVIFRMYLTSIIRP